MYTKIGKKSLWTLYIDFDIMEYRYDDPDENGNSIKIENEKLFFLSYNKQEWYEWSEAETFKPKEIISAYKKYIISKSLKDKLSE
jgi:hypothetical protein